jgi:hypothetical protein
MTFRPSDGRRTYVSAMSARQLGPSGHGKRMGEARKRQTEPPMSHRPLGLRQTTDDALLALAARVILAAHEHRLQMVRRNS